MRATVSNIDAFREWREDPEADLPALIARMRSTEATEPMLRGRAFAKCLQAAVLGQSDTLTADGYTFAFTGDFEIEHFPRREESREKDYGGIIVPGRCDRVLGKLIMDDKTTEYFEIERYLEKYQWRFYLDIWQADWFLWNVWECKKMDEPKAYCVHKMHRISQYRYPRLEADCKELAYEFREFAVNTLGWSA